ncbi:hypothetical protein DRN73_05370 [Candidatus Pacearchaeota archaeon]|nr:MAG: hypothetical protein DRN73_05370 [Candidatus Pacearchaeota archaeon]
MFKINISDKDGKTYKIEAEAPSLIQKKIGDKIKGEDISPDLKEYELEITGISDFAGFTSLKNIEGSNLTKVLLKYGKAMHKKPKGDKKKNKKPDGLRLRKTIRGNTISKAIIQINTKIIKKGSKSLKEIFPEQNKSEKETPKEIPAQEESEQKKEPEKEELAKPEQEPKEAEASKQEKTHPEEEPKEKI